MAQFIVGKEVKTETNSVEVTVDRTAPLPVGRQVFRLVVVDEAGNVSQPDEFTVIVADQDAPTAILRGPRVVGFGSSFKLDGSGSFDADGGRIGTYLWTYVGPAN